MKRYVDRCLQACGGPQHKAAVMLQVQGVIQKELQAGTLHTINWDAQPLIRLETENAVATAVHNTGSPSYYGPSGGTTAVSSIDPPNQSYYGPSPTSTTTTKRKKAAIQLSPPQQKRNSIDNGNYYGPSSFSSSTATLDSTADFISLPSHNKKLVKNSKKRKTENHRGFNQSDSILSSRADRFSGPGGVQEATASSLRAGDDSSEWHKYMGKSIIGGTETKLTEVDFERMTIKGKNMTLEKDFLRLTAPPRAELVRPEPILQQHLANLKAEWRLGPEKRKHDYLWFCSQLKAVRQDCTVQRVQNAFCVDVYETHARIALEESDMNEYNQCQTQLKGLYELLELKQDDDDDDDDSDAQQGLRNRTEFISYRLLYYVFLAVESQDYDGGSSDMFKIMLSLTPQQLADPKIKHALAVREACCSDVLDYHIFFRSQQDCPSTGASQLLDRIVPAMRHKALLRIWKGYRPTAVPVEFVLQELGFETKDETDLRFGREYLKSCGCVLSEDELQIQTKETEVHESNMEVKKSLI